MNIAVFDLETNGYRGASVLSASSIVFDGAGRVLDLYNRFYLPVEPFDSRLVRIHGLTIPRLLALRKRQPLVPSAFIEDWPALVAFWREWDVGGLVIHNARFDMSFLPEAAQAVLPCWCSMRGLTDLCALPKRSGGRGGGAFKWPKLGEAVEILCDGPNALSPTEALARAECAVEDCQAHVSLADCFALYRVAVRVLTHRPELVRFRKLRLGFQPPEREAPFTVNARPRNDAFTAGVLDLEERLREL
ncbi:MAG: 3'-5' exonuclease, partial [Synergistaceae bacterium]|nr:3'-5' exonuclease [Synergistaceae bacterium]